MYETFEHTADLGLRIRAPSLSELFEEAARALFSVLVANPDVIRPLAEIPLEIEGTQREDLLHDWLAELLYQFDGRHLLLTEFEVTLTDRGLSALARGEPLDPKRHELDEEVKAVTYHGLRVEPRAEGWLAEVIVDI